MRTYHASVRQYQSCCLSLLSFTIMTDSHSINNKIIWCLLMKHFFLLPFKFRTNIFPLVLLHFDRKKSMVFTNFVLKLVFIEDVFGITEPICCKFKMTGATLIFFWQNMSENDCINSLRRLFSVVVMGKTLLIISLFVSYNILLQCLEPYQESYLVFCRYLFYVSMNVVTMNTLIYMSVERLLAVTAPFVHSRLDGRRFSLVALSCVWICSITVVASGMHRLSNTINVCLYHVMVPKSTHLVNALLGLLGISFIVSVSLVLYARAKREIVKIGRTMVGTEASRRNHLAEMAEKAASTTLAVVVPFATFNTPLYILMLVFYFSPEFMYSCRSIAFLTSFSTLLVVNSLFNPFIYAWKLRPVQAELRKMMPCRARKPGPAPIAVSSTATKFT